MFVPVHLATPPTHDVSPQLVFLVQFERRSSYDLARVITHHTPYRLVALKGSPTESSGGFHCDARREEIVRSNDFYGLIRADLRFRGFVKVSGGCMRTSVLTLVWEVIGELVISIAFLAVAVEASTTVELIAMNAESLGVLRHRLRIGLAVFQLKSCCGKISFLN